MKKLMIALCFVFVAWAAIAQETALPFIEVTGVAETEVEPDEIDLQIVLNETEGKKMSVEQKEKQLQAVLNELGIDLKNLVLQDALSAYDSNWWKADLVKTVKTFNLRLASAASVAKLLVKLRDKDLSNVQIVKIGNSLKEKIMRETRIKAAKAAKEKAIYLVEAIGNQLGMPLYFIEQEAFQPYAPLMRNTMAKSYASEDSAEPQEIGFKKITYTSKVLIRYGIK
ncbi:MAG: hypothetical protein RIS47_645 [Bacteroidota bacterium]|jgi:uncharacterized protein YggE